MCLTQVAFPVEYRSFESADGEFSRLICISASQVGEMRCNHEVMSRISFDCRVEQGKSRHVNTPHARVQPVDPYVRDP
jgi:hypothetical protein